MWFLSFWLLFLIEQTRAQGSGWQATDASFSAQRIPPLTYGSKLFFPLPVGSQTCRSVFQPSPTSGMGQNSLMYQDLYWICSPDSFSTTPPVTTADILVNAADPVNAWHLRNTVIWSPWQFLDANPNSLLIAQRLGSTGSDLVSTLGAQRTVVACNSYSFMQAQQKNLWVTWSACRPGSAAQAAGNGCPTNGFSGFLANMCSDLVQCFFSIDLPSTQAWTFRAPDLQPQDIVDSWGTSNPNQANYYCCVHATVLPNATITSDLRCRKIASNADALLTANAVSALQNPSLCTSVGAAAFLEVCNATFFWDSTTENVVCPGPCSYACSYRCRFPCRNDRPVIQSGRQSVSQVDLQSCSVQASQTSPVSWAQYDPAVLCTIQGVASSAASCPSGSTVLPYCPSLTNSDTWSTCSLGQVGWGYQCSCTSPNCCANHALCSGRGTLCDSHLPGAPSACFCNLGTSGTHCEFSTPENQCHFGQEISHLAQATQIPK